MPVEDVASARMAPGGVFALSESCAGTEAAGSDESLIVEDGLLLQPASSDRETATNPIARDIAMILERSR
jgi:hypothetical protein